MARPPREKIVEVRFTAKELDCLKWLAEYYEDTMSGVIRDLVAEDYRRSTRKALERSQYDRF